MSAEQLSRLQQAVKAAPWLANTIVSAAVVGTDLPLRDVLSLAVKPSRPATSETLTRLLRLSTLARIEPAELTAYLHLKYQTDRLQDLPERTAKEIVDKHVAEGPKLGPANWNREVLSALKA